MHDDLQWLYLDLNSYFASVEQQLQPQLRGKPIAIVPALTDATSAIAASYEAKAFGIKTGTRIYEAKARCKDLICVPASHDRYVHFHHRMIAAIERHIPIYRAQSIDEFSCALDKNQRSEDAARALALRIKDEIARSVGDYIRCSIGLAPNRFLAKTASNLEKPDGLQVLHLTDIPARLAHLPIEELVGIGQAMQQRLWRVGVVSVGDLYGLAPKQMRQIWGNVGGERFYYMLRGEELPEPPTNRSTVGHSHVLEPAWRPQARAREVMQRLLLKAASRLRRLHYEASVLQLSLRFENGTRRRLSVGFTHCCDSPALQAHAQQLWREALTGVPPQARLKKISIGLFGLRPASESARQPSLFDVLNASQMQRQKRHEQLSRAMDTLNSRFGRDTITLGSLPRQVRCFSGTKIAFTRIPEREEFSE